ncbi:hypothetical protein BDV98DRAFT_560533 [Pterulicium gracile]|uniref:Uncharacterized protein n=1 Tax=Pterulicium gracile TaxID=1884261 RepID=A0A5C3QUM4_9AGAR|nr:hypothetical protein BDV98DRAFT_560533 [Pterula gracilis]
MVPRVATSAKVKPLSCLFLLTARELYTKGRSKRTALVRKQTQQPFDNGPLLNTQKLQKPSSAAASTSTSNST